MINETQNQQDFYTKPSASAVPSTQSAVKDSGMKPTTSTATVGSGSTTPPKLAGMKNRKTKNIIAVAGLVVFVMVALMGVLIAQRQVTAPGEDVRPVAPTAPESQPEASSVQPNSCFVSFTVPEAGVVCNSKTAYTDFASEQGSSPIAPGTEFNVGDEFVFRLAIAQPTQGVAYNVVVEDTLPASLEYVSAPANAGYTITADGQTVTAEIGEMIASSTVTVEFKVRVRNTTFGEQRNTATVTSGSTASTDTENSCSYPYSVVQGEVQCVDKTMYTLEGELVATGGAIDRGEEYEYRVLVRATNRTIGKVRVYDVIPEALEYVRPAAGSEQYIINDPSTGTLIAELGQLEDEDITLGFIVRVPEDPELGEFTNTALVYSAEEFTSEEPPQRADECSVAHTILPIGTAECVEKEAFTDFNGTEIASGSEINPGDEFIYRITVRAEDTTTGPVTLVDELPADLIFVQDPDNTDGVTYNSSTREVTMNFETMESGDEEVVEFKVQLGANPSVSTFTNVATIITDGETEHTCQLPLDVARECNSPCQENSHCSEVGDDDHICYNSGNGSFCRLESNPTDTDCEPGATSTPTPPPTGTPTPTPTPTPTIGCNELCEQNSDCTNIAHICVTTEDGSNRCRLAEYTSSTTCTEPVTTTTTATTQPVLPEQLPETGPADWLNWLKAGLVTLGVGTALFLLL